MSRVKGSAAAVYVLLFTAYSKEEKNKLGHYFKQGFPLEAHLFCEVNRPLVAFPFRSTPVHVTHKCANLRCTDGIAVIMPLSQKKNRYESNFLK
uniref:Uncharacterized protein n=1 Tax=Cyclopterus lumpus TaxID=8103 RepID=A0A8C2WNW9_CYCLU